MPDYTKQELEVALKQAMSFIGRAEKIRGKFCEGTAQHSLLRNRIAALHVSRALLERELYGAETAAAALTEKQLRDALPRVRSIISKNRAAQRKYQSGTSQHRRFELNIAPMLICESLIARELKE